MSLKEELVGYAIKLGLEHPPQVVVDRWVQRLRKPLPPVQGTRLANRFEMAVALEFGASFPAENLAGWLGFISAHNGKFRITTGRSRSCLELVAAMWRGLQALQRSTGEELHTGGFYNKRAFNSVVEFSRTTSGKLKAVYALDALYEAMLTARLLNPTETTHRLSGDGKYQRSGTPSDIRSYWSGFEYRSLPSFGESPLQMFVVLTLVKLALLRTEEVSSWAFCTGKAQARLVNLLAAFKGIDDDARLAHWLVEQKWPVAKYQPIRDWGLTVGVDKLKLPLPLTVEADNVWRNFTRVYFTLRSFIPPAPPPPIVWWKSPNHGALRLSTSFGKWLWHLTADPDRQLMVGDGAEDCVLEVHGCREASQEKLSRICKGTVKVKRTSSILDGRVVLLNADWAQRNPEAPKMLEKVLCSLGCYVQGQKPSEMKQKKVKGRKVLYKSTFPKEEKRIEFRRVTLEAPRFIIGE